MTLNLDTLRKVAEAPDVTAGPWFAFDRGIGYEVHHASGYELNNGHRETFAKPDATHIATFDPPTVLALLSRLEQAEQLARINNQAMLAQAQRAGQAEQAVERAKAECARQREHKGIFARRATEAEHAVQRVREVCESDSYDMHKDYGNGELAVPVDSIMYALDGESNE